MPKHFSFIAARATHPLFERTGKGVCVAGLAGGLAAGLAATADAQVLPPNPDSTCVVTSTEFSSWFKAQPGLNQPVQAANSIGLDTSKNCNFYKWSEQMFLWATSPATSPYQGSRVFGSQVFYQVINNNLIAQASPTVPRGLVLRAAKSGPDGLPVLVDAKGHLREFVTAPSRSGVTAQGALGGQGPAEIATVKAGAGGKAVFLDAAGKGVSFTPKVNADMLPQVLGRLSALTPPAKGVTALSPTAARQQIADVLTAKKVLIKVATKGGPVFVEAGTGIIDELGPGQAQSDGALISQQNSMIFYEILVNDVYAWYLTAGRSGEEVRDKSLKC